MLCTISFPKTPLVFRYYSSKILRHLLVNTSFKYFWFVWQYADRSIIAFSWTIAVFIKRFGQFHVQGKMPTSKPLLSSLCITLQLFADLVTFTEEILHGKFHFLCSVTSFKIKEFVLITFVGRSDSWQALASYQDL